MTMTLTGPQIREARGRVGWTQKELAEAVGVSLRSVSAWERGEAVPRSKMPVLQDVLGTYLPGEDTRRAVLMRLGQLARRRREEIGVSRPKLAQEAGVSLTTIQNLETAVYLPQSHILKRIERVLEWKHGAYLSFYERAGDIDPESIRMEDLEGDAPGMTPPVPRGGLHSYTTDELLQEVRRRVRESDMRWQMFGQGVEIPEPSEFREQPDWDLAANDDMTGGDDPDN